MTIPPHRVSGELVERILGISLLPGCLLASLFALADEGM